MQLFDVFPKMLKKYRYLGTQFPEMSQVTIKTFLHFGLIDAKSVRVYSLVCIHSLYPLGISFRFFRLTVHLTKIFNLLFCSCRCRARCDLQWSHNDWISKWRDGIWKHRYTNGEYKSTWKIFGANRAMQCKERKVDRNNRNVDLFVFFLDQFSLPIVSPRHHLYVLRVSIISWEGNGFQPSSCSVPNLEPRVKSATESILFFVNQCACHLWQSF
jgi:hypothetical protein